jgi:hypothetical protein
MFQHICVVDGLKNAASRLSYNNTGTYRCIFQWQRSMYVTLVTHSMTTHINGTKLVSGVLLCRLEPKIRLGIVIYATDLFSVKSDLRII